MRILQRLLTQSLSEFLEGELSEDQARGAAEIPQARMALMVADGGAPRFAQVSFCA
jgi:hypothetical protein